MSFVCDNLQLGLKYLSFELLENFIPDEFRISHTKERFLEISNDCFACETRLISQFQENFEKENLLALSKIKVNNCVLFSKYN